MDYAGKDATPGFEPIHPKDVLNILPSSSLIGKIDPNSIKEMKENANNKEKQSLNNDIKKPPLEHMLNLFDFERICKLIMKKEAWDYYSSGSDDEITMRENHAAFQVIKKYKLFFIFIKREYG